MTSLINADSLLVVDVGSVHTRAMLFDVVDGRYRFLAQGSSPSTWGAPFNDVGEGVRQAVDQLQEFTGRTFFNTNEVLIRPTLTDGSGVDNFSATVSAGPPLKMVVVGLLEDVSLESACRLAATTYGEVLETISLNDRRKAEERLGAILQLRPDVIVVAGGTEGGASKSLMQLLEPVGLACYLLPESERPILLYAGNQAIQEEVKTSLGGITKLHLAPNLRPTLENEQIEPAQTQMANLYREIRARQLLGIRQLNEWAGGGLSPTATAFGRIIRFISQADQSPKGVLGVDVGASATTIAAAYRGQLSLGVYSQLGLGAPAMHLPEHVALKDILRWLPIDLSEETLLEYLANKSLYPSSIPATAEELAIEQAIARAVMRGAVQRASKGFPHQIPRSSDDLLPWFEPIVASGSVLTRAPHLAQTLMMLLDGLQPTGVTTFILDQHHITPALGVAAAVNPVLSVQVMDTNSLVHLGTVISPVTHARPGAPVLQVKVTYTDSGRESALEVKQGTIEVLPLPSGQRATLKLIPLNRSDVGMGSAVRSSRLEVRGGAMGVVIDARGRPIQMPEDAARRQELLRKWMWTLGG